MRLLPVAPMNPPTESCPHCGSTTAQLAFSREVYPEADADQCGPPEAMAFTFECQCGNVYVVKVALQATHC